MRIVIMHDHLVQRGGAERVVLAMLRALPGAVVRTAFFDRDLTYPEFMHESVTASFLNAVPALRQHHRRALPLMPALFSVRPVEADVVIASSSGFAHGVRTTAPKLVYCYSPARWLYQSQAYLREASLLERASAGVLAPPMRRWDRWAARSADRYLTLSSYVQREIQALYGIAAEVLPPPILINASGNRRPVADVEPGVYLCVARLLAYKHVDAVIEAFRGSSDRRLVVVGTGPLEDRLRATAPPNVRLVGSVTDEELRWLYSQCRAVIGASHEDYGLTPLEGLAFDKPSVVLRFGGYLDTVIEGTTGVFFETPTPAAIRSALDEAEAKVFEVSELRAQGARFTEDAFATGLRRAVDDLVGRSAIDPA